MLFVSAFLHCMAVVNFPLCIRYQVEIAVFSYGIGFYCGLAVSAAYFIAACLLNLDIFIINTVPTREERSSRRRYKR